MKKKNKKIKEKKIYISLKKAAKLSGYTSDYIGYLIRNGKIKGKAVSLEKTWFTTEEEVLNYQNNKKIKKKLDKHPKTQRFFWFRKIINLISALRSFHYALPALIILLAGFSFLTIRAFPFNEVKTEIFPTISEGGLPVGEANWQKSENALVRELGEGATLHEFNLENSGFLNVPEIISPILPSGKEVLPEEEELSPEEGLLPEGESLLIEEPSQEEQTQEEVSEQPSIEEQAEEEQAEEEQAEEEQAEEEQAEEPSTDEPAEEPAEEEPAEDEPDEEPSEEQLPLEEPQPEEQTFLKKLFSKFSFLPRVSAQEPEPETETETETTDDGLQETGSQQEEIDTSGIEPEQENDSTEETVEPQEEEVQEEINEAVEELTSEEQQEIILPTVDGEIFEEGNEEGEEEGQEEFEEQEATIFFEQSNVIYSGFVLPDGRGILKGARIGFSFASQWKEGEDDELLVDWSLDSENWNNLVTFQQNQEYSNAQNSGYFYFELPSDFVWENLENLKIRFTALTNNPQGQELSIYLDSIWLEATYEGENEPEEPEEPEESEESEESEITLLTLKKDFKGSDKPEFQFRYKKIIQKKVLASVGEAIGIIDYWDNINTSVRVINPKGEIFEIPFDLIFKNNGEIVMKIERPKEFKPGLYKIILSIEENGKTKEFEQDFSWGVLAINVNKSIYLSNEEAYIQMAVLRDDGHTICDAKLELRITNQELGIETILSTENNMIQYSGKCGPNNVTDTPDYFAYYQIGKPGIYQMKLINLDNGYEIFDSFEVREHVLFEVERMGPTRIYPRAIYQMEMKIKVNQDFQGQVVETIPLGFEIQALNSNSYILNFSDSQEIIWDVNWNAGESYELEYAFDAPDISPYLYLLGPLEIGSFKEIRQWQIASDATTRYFHETAAVSDSTRQKMSATVPTTYSGEEYVNAQVTGETRYNNGSITETWISDDLVGSATIPTGNWTFKVECYTDRTAGLFYPRVKVYKSTDTITPIFITTSGTACGSSYATNSWTYDPGEITLASGERLVYELWANSTAKGGGNKKDYVRWGDTGVADANKTQLIDTYTPPATISVDGHVYTDELKTLGIGIGKTVRLVVNSTDEGTCDTNSSSYFSFSNITVVADDSVIVYLDGETEDGSTVTLALNDSSDITDLDIITAHISLEHRSAGPITNVDLEDIDDADAGNEDGITVNGSAVFADGFELSIVSGETYTPGGAVTCDDLEVEGTGVFNPAANAVTVSGSFEVSATGTFTSSGTVTFDAVSGTETVITGGVGVDHDFQNLSKTGGGTLQLSTNAIEIDGTLTISGSTVFDLNGQNLTLATLSNSGTLQLFGSETVSITTMDTVSGLVEYAGDGDGSAETFAVKDFGGTDYFNLKINDTHATKDTFQTSANLDVAGALNVTLGALDVSTNSNTLTTTGILTVDGGTLTATNGSIHADGAVIISSGTLTAPLGNFNAGDNWTCAGSSFTHSSGTVIFDATDANNTIEAGSSSFNNLTFSGAGAGNGTWIIQTDDMTAAATLDVDTGDTLSINSSRTVTHSGSVLTLDGTISGAGRLTYQSATTFPTTGTISSILRFEATNNDQVIPVRAYGGVVEAYNNSSTIARTIVLGTAGSQTINFSGSLELIAANTHNVTLDGNTHDPAVNIGGNLDFTGAGGGTEIINSGAGIWTITSGDIDFTAGTYTATSLNTLKMNGTTKSITSAANTLQNFEVSGGSISTIDALDVNGTFKVTGGGFTQGSNVNLNVAGNFTLSVGTTFDATGAGSGLLVLDGELNYIDNTSPLQDVGNVHIGTSPDTTNLGSNMKANSLTVNTDDYFYTNGYDLDIGNQGIIISGTFDALDDVTLDETFITNAGNFTINSGASFVQDQSTLTFDGTSGTNDLITNGAFSLYNLIINGNVTVEVEDALDVDNDLIITAGTLDVVSLEDNSITVGGSWDNDDTFEARSGTVTFDAGSGTKTIDADGTGTDAFYDIIFNDNGGPATFQLTTVMDVNRNLTITGGNFDANSNNITVGGNWTNNDTFTSGTQIVTFDATDSGHTINAGSSSFSSVIFDGVNGEWSPLTNTMTITGDLTMTNGTLNNTTGSADITVNSSVAGSGTITLTAGTFEQRVDEGESFGSSSGSNTWTFNNLTFSNSNAGAAPVGITTSSGGDGGITVSGILTIGGASDASGATITLDADNRTWTLSGTGGNPFQKREVDPIGDLNPSGSTFIYTGNYGAGSTTIQSETYNILQINNGSESYNLEGATTSSDVTIIAGILDPDGNALIVTNDLTVNGNLQGAGDVTVNGSATGSGAVILSSGTFLQRVPSAETFGSSSGSNNWTFNNLTFENSSGSANQTIIFSATGTGQIIVSNVLSIGNAGDSYTAILDNEVNDRIIDVDGDVTITSKGTLEASSTALFNVGGSWDNNGTFTRSNGKVIFDSSSGETIFDNKSAFYDLEFTGSGSWTYTDEGTTTATNSTSVSDGTVTFINARTGTVSVTSTGTLQVDWYLGVHAVDTAETVNIDTDACDDIIISESGSNLTVWRHNGSVWGTGAAEKTTGTGTACNGADGKNPQPDSDGAIRIREYSMTNSATCPGAGCTLYNYNIHIDWTTSGSVTYGEYDYYNDYGGEYLTSCFANGDTCDNDGTNSDDTIGANWHRDTKGTMNTPYDSVNEPPTKGSWYCGMLDGLIFEITAGTTIDFADLGDSNDWQDDTPFSTLQVTTSATNGYVITAWAKHTGTGHAGELKLQSFDTYIANSSGPGTNASPADWDGKCIDGSPKCGFGYNTNDNSLTGGGADRFVNAAACGTDTKCWAAFTDSGAGDPVADRSNTECPCKQQTNNITYKVSSSGAQVPGKYETTVIYICTAKY